MSQHAIDGHTQLVGVIGWPVAHTLSPAMHNAAFAYLSMNWCYVPLPAQENALISAIRGITALSFRGANITVPHKTAVLALMDSVTDSTQAVGAVNTIRINRGESVQLEGLNTDVTGFLTDLAVNNIRVDKTSRILILGAGGAARACAAGMARSGARITLVNRTMQRALEVVTYLKSTWPESNIAAEPYTALPKLVESGISLIVNATTVGLWPDVKTTPWPSDVPFPKDATVYDTIYRPLRTQLMQDAEKAGLRAIGGLGMLIYQGAASFETWTGQKPPIAVMRKVVEAEINP